MKQWFTASVWREADEYVAKPSIHNRLADSPASVGREVADEDHIARLQGDRTL
jgi:hypothetical protein